MAPRFLVLAKVCSGLSRDLAFVALFFTGLVSNSRDDISGFLDLVPDYTRRALKAASLLGIVGEDSATGKFRKVEATKLFAFCKRLSHPNLFRCHLEQFPPFRHFKSRIMISVEPLQAAREVKSLFNITSDAHLIRDILVNWGTYAGALQRLDGIEISSTSTDFVMDAGPGIIVELYSQQAEIEQYIRKQWSKKTNDFVPNDVVNNLVIGSSKTANEQPFREIILPLGNAFEDYLKHVAGTRTPVIDLAGCNGISQVGERLNIMDP